MYRKPKIVAVRFTEAQRQFLIRLYERKGSKYCEKAARLEMEKQFNRNNGGEHLLLSEKQIKSWFSAESRRRRKQNDKMEN